MKGGAFVVDGSAGSLSIALLAGAQGTKGLDDFVGDGGEEYKVDSTGG